VPSTTGTPARQSGARSDDQGAVAALSGETCTTTPLVQDVRACILDTLEGREYDRPM